MRWLPDYGVGIIAFGNLTYTGWGRPVDSALDALDRDRRARAAEVQPSPALVVGARRRSSRLVINWDDALADRIAAENLFLDAQGAPARGDRGAAREVGACRAASGSTRSRTRCGGEWTMPCERGALRVAITLAPTIPPKVQFMSIRPAPADMPKTATCPR